MTYNHLIGGALVSSQCQFLVTDPATGQPFAECPAAGAHELEMAIAAARRAFAGWSALTFQARSQAVNRIADLIEANAESFAQMLGKEQGKPIVQARWETAGAIEFARASASLRIEDVVLADNENGRLVRTRVPLGIVGAIVPWNYPLLILIAKIAPALMAGNTVVAKPAPTTPLTALMLGELVARELPAGVINILGDSGDLGPLISSHPEIASISFTGSTATGKKVMEAASGSLKRLVLELGGNDAAVALDDVDTGMVASALFAGAMENSGQLCAAIKRAYVHETVYDEICSKLAELARQAKVGPASDPDSQFGPIQNRTQFERVKSLIRDSEQDGTIIAGGLPDDSATGYFIQPTIIRDLDETASIVREEQFGPVLPVLKFSDIDDVIARVNDTQYGLTASVWSADPARAEYVARRLHVGQVWINKHLDASPLVAAEGAKGSGFGMAYGVEGLLEFTQPILLNFAK